MIYSNGFKFSMQHEKTTERQREVGRERNVIVIKSNLFKLENFLTIYRQQNGLSSQNKRLIFLIWEKCKSVSWQCRKQVCEPNMSGRWRREKEKKNFNRWKFLKYLSKKIGFLLWFLSKIPLEIYPSGPFNRTSTKTSSMLVKVSSF